MRTVNAFCLAATLLAFASAADASPVVSAHVHNPDFTIPTAGTAPGDAVITGPFSTAMGWYSASAGWTTWANTPGTEHVSWIATSVDGITANLFSAGGPGGLVQVLSDPAGNLIGQDTPTDVNRITIYVKLLAGRVGLQLGNGGEAGGPAVLSRPIVGWQKMSTCGRGDRLNNEVTIYAGGAPAVFYVARADVSYDPRCDAATAK